MRNWVEAKCSHCHFHVHRTLMYPRCQDSHCLWCYSNAPLEEGNEKLDFIVWRMAREETAQS